VYHALSLIGFVGKCLFVPRTKGSPLLILEGFVYTKQKILSTGATSWECSQRRNARGCTAKVKTQDGRIVGRTNVHSHLPDPAKVETLRVHAQMKVCTRNPGEFAFFYYTFLRYLDWRSPFFCLEKTLF
jgi:hypothetical protein